MHRTTLRRLSTVAITGLVAAPLLVLTTSTAEAAPLNGCVNKDNGDPVLDDLDFSATVADVTTVSASLSVTATAHDAGGPGAASGISAINATLTPMGGGSRSVYVLFKASGGSWVGTAKFPRGTTNGAWVVQSLSVTDRAGNYVNYFYDTMPPGSEKDLYITSTEDTTAPTFTQLTLTPGSVRTTTKPVNVTVAAQLADADSGPGYAVVFATGPNGKSTSTTLIPGSGGTLRGSMSFGRWIGSGTWKIGATAYDAAGNSRTYSTSDLATAGLPSTIAVTSGTDTKKPKVTGFTKSRKKLDVRTKKGKLKLEVTAKDKKAGIAIVSVAFSGPDGVHSTGVDLKRKSGTAKKGTWKGKAVFQPCQVTPGTWKITVYAYDGAGNSVFTNEKTVKIKAVDHTWPTMSPSSQTIKPTGKLTVRFSEDVNGVSNATLPVYGYLAGVNVLTSGAWTCTTAGGSATSCTTGKVRTAAFTPTTPFETGDNKYYAVANPSGQLGLTDLAGNPIGNYYAYANVTE